MQIEYVNKTIVDIEVGDLIITKYDVPLLVTKDFSADGHPTKLVNMNTAKIHDIKYDANEIKNVIKSKDLKLIVTK